MPNQQQPVVLVTGASSGMGQDFALRLLQEGYAVYAAARRIERMAKRPATRYHGGLLAGPLLFLRRVLPDRMLDALILSSFR